MFNLDVLSHFKGFAVDGHGKIVESINFYDRKRVIKDFIRLTFASPIIYWERYCDISLDHVHCVLFPLDPIPFDEIHRCSSWRIISYNFPKIFTWQSIVVSAAFQYILIFIVFFNFVLSFPLRSRAFGA